MNTFWLRFPKALKAWTDVLQGAGTVVALIAALWWFHAQRFTSLNLKLEQTVTQRSIPDDDSQILLAIDVRATNIGKVGINLNENSGELYVYRVFTDVNGKLVYLAHDKQIYSTKLTGLLLQPGESDQVGLYLLPVERSLKSVRIDSYYKAPDTGQYWSLESVIDLTSAQNRTEGHSESQQIRSLLSNATR